MDTFASNIERNVHTKYRNHIVQWYELIDWTESLLLCLYCFHICLLMLVIITRKHIYLQFFLFVLITILVMISQELNKYGRIYWKSIANQQYFDTRGVFIGLFYAAPLLCIGFIQLILNLKHMAELIIIVKRSELQAKRKKQGDRNEGIKAKEE